MKSIQNQTTVWEDISPTSVISFFGIFFCFIPFKQTSLMGWTTVIIFIALFGLSIWTFYNKVKPKYKVFFQVFMILGGLKIMWFIVSLIKGGDPLYD